MRGLAVVSFLLLAGACSLVVESSPSQCETDADCYSRGGDFSASICVIGRCVPPDGGAPGGQCTTNQECTTKLNAPALCRKSDHICSRILSPDCQTIKGDSTNDDAIFIGSLNSVTLDNGPSGIARQSSADLALAEIFTNTGGGIRPTPTGTPRPLVLVECDDSVNAVVPATHLVKDLEVPAIIGIASSSNVIDVATNVTVPAGVLVISAAATSPAITLLPDNNLVWRTSPSDVSQALALNDQLPAVEAKYRADNAVATTARVRLEIVYVNESYGQGLFTAVTRDGKLNGKPISDSSNSGSVNALTYQQNATDLEAQIANILGQDPRPNIIAGFGSTEIIKQLVGPLEARWGTTYPKPVYLFADAVQKTELLTLVETDNLLRKRIRGTVPAAPRASPNFKSFVINYESTYGKPAPTVFGMAGSYDSVFLLGYLIAAAGDRTITGSELQKGFARLVTGAKVDVGGSNMSAGLSALLSPGMFDFEGASGPLDFDLTTGEAPSNIDVWCIQKNGGSGTPAFVPSGRTYDATLGMMTGAYSTTTCQGAAAD